MEIYEIYDGIGVRTTSVTTSFPVVTTRCQYSWRYDWPELSEEPLVYDTNISYFHENGSSLGTLFDLGTLADRLSNFNGTSSATIALDDEWSGSGAVVFHPLWMTTPESGSESLLVVFSFWRNSTSGEIGPDAPQTLSQVIEPALPGKISQRVGIMSCTISSYWNIGEVQLWEEKGTADVRMGRSSLDMSELRNARKITLDVAHIDALQSPNFVRDLNGIATLDRTLSKFVAIAISAIPVPGSNVTLQEDMPLKYKEPDMSSFRHTTVMKGYGYGNRPISVRLAMAVMTTYCVVSVAYIAYILITGSTSTAWNSGIEIVSLALQSRKPDHLGNSGVGIDSIKTYQEGVGIRVNQENELELVFANDRDIEKRGLRKLERNVEY
jgi:hypothetical protein